MIEVHARRARSRCFLFLLALACLASPALFAAKSISQYGITWTFDRDYQTGQFANGDHWVVGPVKITAISPKPTSTMHGSMLNPGVNTSQGYDSRIKNNPYSSALNVGLKLPLTVAPGSSLLSSESHSAKSSGDNPQLKTIAILTVLDKPAPAGSFRPPYIGTDKALRWNKSQLNYGKLRSLAPVAGTPSLASVEAKFERPWIEQKTNWTGRYMHPSANQPPYGREISHTLAQGVLALQLNYSNAQKEKLLVRMVQYGIDVYGAAKAGAKWNTDGGHNQGRKMPLLLAGTVLGDKAMTAFADAKNKFIFQEDQSTWYVTKSDVGRKLYTGDDRPRDRYLQSDVGMAEWGEKHHVDPSRDGRNWDAFYRTVTGSCTIGHILTARLMDVKDDWNWPAVFDYYDRFWARESGSAGGGQNSIPTFVANMWKAYRHAKGSNFTEENTSTADIWQNQAFKAQSGSFSVAFTMVAAKAKMDGVTGLSAGAADAIKDLAASVRFAPSGFIDAANGSTWQAANTLAYTAGVKYRVVIAVDLDTNKYSVQVTPQNGRRVTIATNWNLRSEQRSVAKLANVGFVSSEGAHSVLNVEVTGGNDVPAASKDDADDSRDSAAESVLRVNAGGAKYTDKAGRTWSADKGYLSGLTAGKTKAIAGTEDDKLFQTNRYDNSKSAAKLAYRFSLPNGSYNVRLLFAETAFSAKGKRRFDVKAEGKVVVDNLDIYAKAGGANKALVITVPVTVKDKTLDLEFINDKASPQINAIEVLKR